MRNAPTIYPTPGVYDGQPMVHVMLDSWATNGRSIQSDGLSLDAARALANEILDAVTTAANAAHDYRRARFTTVVVTHRHTGSFRDRDHSVRRLAYEHGGTDSGGGYDLETGERELFFDFDNADDARDFSRALPREFQANIMEPVA